MSVRRAQREYDVDVRWRAYPLHPDTPAEGMDYRAYLGGEAAWQAGAARLGGMAAALGLAFRMPERKFNSRRAEELSAWAVEDFPAQAEALRTALFEAIWVAGVDNGDPEVLAEVAAAAGLPRDAVVTALEQRRGADAVDADWREALARRIRGVPASTIGDRELMGAQPWSVFVEALDTAGIPRR